MRWGRRRRRSKQIKTERGGRERYSEKDGKQATGRGREMKTEQMRDSWRGQASQHLREQLSVLVATIRVPISGPHSPVSPAARDEKVADTYTRERGITRTGGRVAWLFSPPDPPGRSLGLVQAGWRSRVARVAESARPSTRGTESGYYTNCTITVDGALKNSRMDGAPGINVKRGRATKRGTTDIAL